MANGVADIGVIGNLAADPEVRFTGDGTPVASFRMGVTKGKKTKEGWADHTMWFRVSYFGKRGEKFAEVAKKGSQVYVQGGLLADTYTGAKGPGISLDVKANEVRFVGPKPGTGADANGVRSGGGNKGGGGSDGFHDGDLPF